MRYLLCLCELLLLSEDPSLLIFAEMLRNSTTAAAG